MAFCSKCGAQMTGSFCGGCGAAAESSSGGPAAPSSGPAVGTGSSSQPLTNNAAAALCYLLGIITGVDLGDGSELGVRAKDQVDPARGPLDFATATIASGERILETARVGECEGGSVRRLPLRVHVEQVHKEIVRQCSRATGEDAVLGTFGVGAEDAQATHKHRHFWSGKGEQIGRAHV